MSKSCAYHTQMMSHGAFASSVNAASFCAQTAHNTVALIMDAMIMASIIICGVAVCLSILSISLGLLALVLLAGLLAVGKVNAPKTRMTAPLS